MAATPPSVKQRLGVFGELCRTRGLAVTHQRLAIYHALARTDTHPTAEMIYRRIHAQYPTLSLATVYKTLETLELNGLISRFIFLKEAARYDANLNRHHHRVCVRCGRVEDFYDPSLDRLSMAGHARLGFKVLTHQVQIHGVCRRCRRRSPGLRPRLDK